MEKLKEQHKHALTQWLKVIIFGILLLAPFFSVLSRCLYVTCNKNAKDSYSDEYISKIELVNDKSMLIEGNLYECKYETTTNQDAFTFQFTNISFDPTQYGFTNRNYTGFITLNNILYLYYDNIYDNNHRETKAIWGTTLLNFTFTYNGSQSTNSTYINSGNRNIFGTYLTKNYLDNVFEYSVNELNNTPIFNWVQNTAIYTPINAMTNGLGFTENNNVLALLLTYWTLLTCVYVVFDIVIACFVKITHMVIE